MATTDATLMFWVVGCQFALWELSAAELAAGRGGVLGLPRAGHPHQVARRPGPDRGVGRGLVVVGGPRPPPGSGCDGAGGPWSAPRSPSPGNVAILIHSHGEYYRVAVGLPHSIRRATNGIEEHGGFPGYYVALGLLTFFPWSTFFARGPGRGLVPAQGVARRSGSLLGWVVGPLILLECVRTKADSTTYLPALPRLGPC